MILVGIDIGKKQHTFSVIDKGTGEILSNPSVFDNNQNGFLFLIKKLSNYVKPELLIGMEDTGHYHFALLKYLLDNRYTVALINPTTTDLTSINYIIFYKSPSFEGLFVMPQNPQIFIFSMFVWG